MSTGEDVERERLLQAMAANVGCIYPKQPCPGRGTDPRYWCICCTMGAALTILRSHTPESRGEPRSVAHEPIVYRGAYEVGAEGALSKDLPTLCCPHVIPAGTRVRVWRIHSPRRVWVQVIGGWEADAMNSLHKVKISNLCLERRIV